MRVTSHVLPPLTWHISQIIIDVLFSNVRAYVLNQSCGHWLLFYSLNVTIIMNLKFKEKFGISFNLQDLIDDDYIVAHELSLLASNIRRKLGLTTGEACTMGYLGSKHHPKSVW